LSNNWRGKREEGGEKKRAREREGEGRRGKESGGGGSREVKGREVMGEGRR
jgi:hypothetical protein